MVIVAGRGNRRKTLELPCSSIVKNSSAKEQKQAVSLVCSMLGIKGKV